MLFDWLVIGQIISVNPVSSVRGPKHMVRKGKTPVLGNDEARALLDAIDTSSLIGLCDRALISLMVYSFARISAALGIKIDDYLPRAPAALGPPPRERRQGAWLIIPVPELLKLYDRRSDEITPDEIERVGI